MKKKKKLRQKTKAVIIPKVFRHVSFQKKEKKKLK
jgi:hypothetical protein